MAICWYCHWGWAEPVVEIYLEALKCLDGNCGPLLGPISHIVWADENFNDISIKWCLKNFNKHKSKYNLIDQGIIKRSLKELLKIPEDIRCPCPKDYNGIDPENYPSTVKTIKI